MAYGRTNRRTFLAQGIGMTAALAAASTLRPKRVSANDKIGIGMIGVGRRGRQLMGLPPDAEIVAVADVYPTHMDEVAAGKSWTKYPDYRDLLADDRVDAVIIASPDHWHAIHAVHACQAGKDAYVEKPLTLTIAEGRAMVEAARAHGRIVQTGSQQRSMAACRMGCELVRNGLVGKIKTVHTDNYPSPWECDLPEQPVPEGLNWDMWCGQTEVRPFHEELFEPRVRGQEAGWISFRPYSGGEMTGWGSHGLDMIQWALGTDKTGPVEVWPIPGTEPTDDKVHKGPLCHVGFRYADGVELYLDGKGPAGGGLFEGELGSIRVDRGTYTVTTGIGKEPDGPEQPVTLPVSANHMQNWLDCIRSRELPIADVEIGHRSTTVCHLGNIARWANRPLKWDPDAERFIDDDDANAYVSRPMREPWTL